jgi:hypothetical protein
MHLNVVVIIFLCCGVSSAIISGFLVHREIEEVNRQKLDHEQIEYAFMYPGKIRKIAFEYKQLYPNGRVNFWRLAFQTAMFVFLGLAAAFGGFLR